MPVPVVRVLAAGAAAVLLAAGLSACSSSSTATSSPVSTGLDPVGWTPPGPCDPPEGADSATAAALADTPGDYTLTSFDGAQIRFHWFPQASATADAPAPTVLWGPGWGGSGETDVTSTQGPGIKTLHDAGYNVLTWDPRGFGKSTGTVETDSADYEGKDVQLLLTWVADQPEAQLDGTSDPRVGMVGGSYGGGIQLITAATDCRVDVIVPEIAWHSLVTSLYKSETYKSGWASLLLAGAAGRSLDPHITDSVAEANATGTLPSETVDWFAARGPGDLVSQIQVPTLIEQGTVDTLFTLQEGVENYQLLQQAGVPVAMTWFCGGHGTCLTNAGDPYHLDQATMAWLNRYLKRDTSVDPGPGFSYIDQTGAWHTAAAYPVAPGTPLTAGGSGTLALQPTGASGPATIPASDTDALSGIVAQITPSRATNAVNVDVPAGSTAGVVVGAPELTISYSGTSPDGAQPTRVFAQLVDPTTGIVLGNQVTPIPVTLDGQRHQLTIPLEQVAFATTANGKITLQLVAVAAGYATPRLGGTVTFDKISISLPT